MTTIARSLNELGDRTNFQAVKKARSRCKKGKDVLFSKMAANDDAIILSYIGEF